MEKRLNLSGGTGEFNSSPAFGGHGWNYAHIHTRTAPNFYAHLMEEDEKTASLRDHLKSEMDKLQQAMSSINGLECPSGSSSSSETIPSAPIVDVDYDMDGCV